MSGNENKGLVIRNETDLKVFLAKNYMTQIKNFFSTEERAMKFMSSVMAAVQKMPKLLDCEPMSVVNSFMTMAQLGLMPSDVSGEAYVLPYKEKAQFQLGYQGLITLFYRAGGIGIRAEIVRKNDKFSYINGVVNHEIDILKSNKERGEAVAAYAIANVNGQDIAKAMNIEDIMEIGKNFSKSYNSEYSPWNPKNDPDGWMLKKTVLKQLGKLLPKNETINRAIDADNQDSRISELKGMVEDNSLKMGQFLKNNDDKNKSEEESGKGEKKAGKSTESNKEGDQG